MGNRVIAALTTGGLSSQLQFACYLLVDCRSGNARLRHSSRTLSSRNSSTNGFLAPWKLNSCCDGRAN